MPELKRVSQDLIMTPAFSGIGHDIYERVDIRSCRNPVSIARFVVAAIVIEA
jgi:hypothetical protein